MILINPKIWTLEELAEQELFTIRGEKNKRLYYKNLKGIHKLELCRTSIFLDKLVGRNLFICSEIKKQKKQFYLGHEPINPNILKITTNASVHSLKHPISLLSINPFKERKQKDYLKLERTGQYLTIPRGFYLK